MYRKIVTLIPRSAKVSIKKILRKLRDYFNLYVLRKQPIIVHQMGKVGSRSVYVSLKSRKKWVFHVHSLRPDVTTKAIQRHKLQGRKYYLREFDQWLWLSHHIVEKQKPAKYITLVRDPIARGISEFFEHLDRNTGCEDAHHHLSLIKINEALLQSQKMFQVPLGWFDYHIKSILGVDIYQYPFPKEQGYLRITEGNVDLLILKLETDDAIKERCIAEFLGIDDFKLTRANVGSEKVYSNAYKEFTQSIIIPPEIMEKCYNSKFMRHFYTDEEIEHLKSRWLRNTIESPSPK
jgi:hypothetical protein